MSDDRILLFATRNQGKVAELVELTRGIEGLEVRSIEDYDLPEVIEDGDTFAHNAAKKAREVSAATGLPALADDSGLEVDALALAPGVHSARYAGPACDDEANNRKLV
jgi:XTP/dITP diphosphohydrolase